jgi:hypothetical protein
VSSELASLAAAPQAIYGLWYIISPICCCNYSDWPEFLAHLPERAGKLRAKSGDAEL